jgi:DNA-binding MarR family transcriptional regulator
LQLLQQIAVAGRQLRRVLTRFLGDFDLNDTELLLLWVCDGAGVEGIAQNRLADSVGLSPAQVSGLVERMGRRHLIERCTGSADRRRRLWRIGSTGRQTLGQVLARLAPAASACQLHVEPAGWNDLVRRLAGVGDTAAKVADGSRVTQSLRVFPEHETWGKLPACHDTLSQAGSLRHDTLSQAGSLRHDLFTSSEGDAAVAGPLDEPEEEKP